MFAMKRPRRAATEDSMDPRVMTERQQLAFLLRATAPSDTSSSSSDSYSSSDSEEDVPPRRPVKRSKTRGSEKESPSATDTTPVIYCGRGRPPKNAIKLPKNTVHPHSRVPIRMSPRGHETRSTEPLVATTISESCKGKIMASRALKAETKLRDRSMKHEKNSPSSASDVAMLSRSAASPFCALCCDLEAFCDAPLFLCPACDQKYPTQQALGRVCMT
ncbi:hypothetical protein Plhal304r1_c088g0170291 [Plasmopara halstedii]